MGVVDREEAVALGILRSSRSCRRQFWILICLEEVKYLDDVLASDIWTRRPEFIFDFQQDCRSTAA